jgi:hypothetical protein
LAAGKKNKRDGHEMLLTGATTTRLLSAIETDSLVLLCGAGLSIPSPSSLPSAVSVSQRCFDKWLAVEPGLDPALRNDVDKLAAHFHARGDFGRVFIPLVPWNELVGSPNAGHAAVADLLISRGARAALSANFDALIESWAESRKVAMEGALTGQEAAGAVSPGPLLKFHGCLHRGRPQTLWTHGQLAEAAVAQRVASCAQWMNLVLPGKHLVVVGFWTDWGYLNDVLDSAFSITNASSVTVVDPDTTANLQAKAPGLWAKLNTLSTSFEHVQASGAEALDELRTTYSRVWARRLFALGVPMASSLGIAESDALALTSPDGLSGDDLYDLRCDGEGVPYNRAAAHKVPPTSAGEVALAHMQLLHAGAARQGAWLEYKGLSIRVVNGAGQGLSTIQSAYKEPSTLEQAEIVICAGAINLGVPARVVAMGRGASVVRPGAGGPARWMTRDEALAELGL